MYVLKLGKCLDTCPRPWRKMIQGLRDANNISMTTSLPIELLHQELKLNNAEFNREFGTATFADEQSYIFWMMRWQ